jgi:hypothetical protein
MTEEPLEITTSSLKKIPSSPSLILNSLSNKSKTAGEHKHSASASEATFIQTCKYLNLQTEKILSAIINGFIEDYDQCQHDISTIKNEICKLSAQPNLSEEDKKLWTNLLQKLELTHLCLHVEKQSNPYFNTEICNPAFTGLFFAITQQRNIKQFLNIWKKQKELSAEWILFIAAIVKSTELGVIALQKKAEYSRVCKWILTNCEAEKHLVMAYDFWNETFKELQTIKQVYDTRFVALPNSQPSQQESLPAKEMKNEFLFLDTPTSPTSEECKSVSLKTSSFSADTMANNTKIEASKYSSASHWNPKSSPSKPNAATTPKKLNLEKSDDGDEASVLNYDFI